jgi:hypothetical protein
MSRRVAPAVLALFLFGCATGPGAPVQERAPAGAQFATELAGPDTYLYPMPTAIVLLKPDDMTRNRAFCQAFVKLQTASEAEAKSVIAPNLIRTRWLTQLKEMPAERARDCDYLTGTYDYSRAAGLIASLRDVSGSMAGNGPFLAMVIPGNGGMRMVAVDGSHYDSAQFDKFTASWNDAIDRAQSQIAAQPGRPGVVESSVDLVAAVLRAVFGGTAGLIQGVIGAL